MSITIGQGADLPATGRTSAVLRWRVALWAAVAAGGALGFASGAAATDADLLLLLRFMAVLKGAMALAAAAFVTWRMAAPLRPGMAVAYVVATAVMSVGPGLMWDTAHVALGAAAVHGGLSALMVLAWMDRAGWNGVLGAALARRRA